MKKYIKIIEELKKEQAIIDKKNKGDIISFSDYYDHNTLFGAISGVTKIKSYDIVGEQGFSNARMEWKPAKSKKSDFLTEKQLEKYSDYLADNLEKNIKYSDYLDWISEYSKLHKSGTYGTNEYLVNSGTTEISGTSGILDYGETFSAAQTWEAVSGTTYPSGTSTVSVNTLAEAEKLMNKLLNNEEDIKSKKKGIFNKLKSWYYEL